MFERPLANSLGFFRRVDSAGRVRRRAEQQHLGLVRAGGLKLFNRDLVILVSVSEDLNGHTARKRNRFGVGGPVGGREQDLIARIYHGSESLEYSLLSTVSNQNLSVRIDLVTRITQGLLCDRLTKCGQTLVRRVLVHRRILSGLNRGLNNVIRGGEIGLSSAKPDYGTAGSLHFFRAVRNR